MYEVAKLVHLISAVIFGGVVFTEVVLLPALKSLGNDFHKKAEITIIKKRGIKIVPIFVILLYFSGIYMFHFYIKELDLSTNFAKLLLLKVLIAFSVLILVITAIILFIKGKGGTKFLIMLILLFLFWFSV